MQSIGERLEEARKRKGISLREASEATKIRSDFLSSIEQNKFDFELPEIYKRGFVKNYASYLNLDSKSILTDFNAQLLSSSDANKRLAGSELFGSMDLKSPSEENISGKTHLGKMSANPKAEESVEKKKRETEIDNSFYVKAGLAAFGVLSFLVVIVGLIVSILSENDEPGITTNNFDTPSATITTPRNTTETSPSEPTPENVSLIANGTVYVLVKQRNDNKELVRKTLSEGETHEFTKEGPIDILFTAGENLVIVNSAGKRLRPKGEGTAKISIP